MDHYHDLALLFDDPRIEDHRRAVLYHVFLHHHGPDIHNHDGEHQDWLPQAPELAGTATPTQKK